MSSKNITTPTRARPARSDQVCFSGAPRAIPRAIMKRKGYWTNTSRSTCLIFWRQCPVPVRRRQRVVYGDSRAGGVGAGSPEEDPERDVFSVDSVGDSLWLEVRGPGLMRLLLMVNGASCLGGGHMHAAVRFLCLLYSICSRLPRYHLRRRYGHAYAACDLSLQRTYTRSSSYMAQPLIEHSNFCGI